MRALILIFSLSISVAVASKLHADDKLLGQNEFRTHCVKCHIIDNNIHMPFYKTTYYFEQDAALLIDIHHETSAKAYFNNQDFQNNKKLIQHYIETTGPSYNDERYYDSKSQKFYLKNCKKCHGNLHRLAFSHYSDDLDKYFDNDAMQMIKVHHDTDAKDFFISEKFKKNSSYLRYILITNSYDKYDGCCNAGGVCPMPPYENVQKTHTTK